MERHNWTRNPKLALTAALATAAVGGGCYDQTAVNMQIQGQYASQRAGWLAAGFKEGQIPSRAEWEAGVTLDKNGRKVQPARAPAYDRMGGGEGGGGGGGGGGH